MSKQDSRVKSGSKSGSKKYGKVKKKQSRTIPSGIAHIIATFNNTIITITDPAGNVVTWSSSGRSNFKGARKSSAYAASIAAQNAGKSAVSFGMKEVEVNLKGPGGGREAAVRGLQSSGLIITVIRDKTSVSHNGCRPRKRRRV